MLELGSSGSVRGGCSAMSIPTAILDPLRTFKVDRAVARESGLQLKARLPLLLKSAAFLLNN